MKKSLRHTCRLEIKIYLFLSRWTNAIRNKCFNTPKMTQNAPKNIFSKNYFKNEKKIWKILVRFELFFSNRSFQRTKKYSKRTKRFFYFKSIDKLFLY